MTLNEVRPHIQSRLAHELGGIFLDQLPIITQNKMQEKDTFVASVMSSPELARQLAPKMEPDMLMDCLFESSISSGNKAVVKNTNPKGHSYVQMATNSCYLILMRRESKNTNNAIYYTRQALLNSGLISESQGDLLALTLTRPDESIDDLLFVCVEVGWQADSEILDISFILPHPTKGYPLFSFSLSELQKAVSQPLTDIAEEPIVSIKRRIDDADQDQTNSNE